MQTWIGWRIVLTTVISGIIMACFAQRIAARDSSMHEGFLVFEDHETGDADRPRIMISRADGSQRRVLVPLGARPKWFPSGDRVLCFIPEYVSHASRSLERYDGILYPPGKSVIVDLQGQVQKELPYRVTDISPTGSKLLVLQADIREFEQYGFRMTEYLGSKTISIYDLKTNSLKRIIGLDDLPRDWSASSLENAQWFPDEDRFAFLVRVPRPGDRFGLSALAMVRLDGTGLHLLTQIPKVQPIYLSGPLEYDIAPDGSKLIYWQIPYGSSPVSQLYVINADGSNVRQLTKGKPWKKSPIWSPDGNKILYTAHPVLDELHRDIALWVMGADGAHPRRVFPGGWRHFLHIPFVAFEYDDHAAWWASPIVNK